MTTIISGLKAFGVGKIALIVILIITVIAHYAQVSKLDKQIAEQDYTITLRDMELAVKDAELVKAQAAIAVQNAQIEAIRHDSDKAISNYTDELNRLQTSAAQTKMVIKTELLRDPSCENELQLINAQLLDFFGGEK
jgi:hypothetical protein